MLIIFFYLINSLDFNDEMIQPKIINQTAIREAKMELSLTLGTYFLIILLFVFYFLSKYFKD